MESFILFSQALIPINELSSATWKLNIHYVFNFGPK